MGDEEQEWLPPDEDKESEAPNADESADTGTDGPVDISDTPAPSVGPNTTIEREPPEERLAKHEQSDVDAMGLEKRREVVGGSYGASLGRQATLYGGALAVIAILVIGFILLAGELDKAPETIEDQAPWSEPQAAQTPPSEIQ